MNYFIRLLLLLIILQHGIIANAQTKISEEEVKVTMLKATQFMVEKVSMNGGYVWYYLPDFSRQWGEMEAYKTMIWLQDPGTISMGNVFLNAYEATENAYYYEAAQKAAAAIIRGQSPEGGWNYMIDFAGEQSLKEWYSTIGKNGWRLEEFQHYYGNSTFDDNVTADASQYLLRMYLEKMDPLYKPALDKAIDFIVKSQYSTGGWPQRYPLMYDFRKNGNPDYTSYYTFNDDVIYANINFLIRCYMTLGEERFLAPIIKGMEFMLLAQQENGAWGQQYDMDIRPAGARTYEPNALLPKTTFENALILLKFFEYTGDQRFATAAARAIGWLDQVKLTINATEDGKYTHPSYIDIETGRPVYVHRKGSNVIYGYYYYDEKDTLLLGHSRGKTSLPLDVLTSTYDRLTSLPTEELTKNSPLIPGKFEGASQKIYDLNYLTVEAVPDKSEVRKLIDSLNEQNCWLEKHPRVSNPYIGDGKKKEPTDKYASTLVGDETDTSPFLDKSEQEYISTRMYIENTTVLIHYLSADKN